MTLLASFFSSLIKTCIECTHYYMYMYVRHDSSSMHAVPGTHVVYMYIHVVLCGCSGVLHDQCVNSWLPGFPVYMYVYINRFVGVRSICITL